MNPRILGRYEAMEFWRKNDNLYVIHSDKYFAYVDKNSIPKIFGNSMTLTSFGPASYCAVECKYSSKKFEDHFGYCTLQIITPKDLPHIFHCSETCEFGNPKCPITTGKFKNLFNENDIFCNTKNTQKPKKIDDLALYNKIIVEINKSFKNSEEQRYENIVECISNVQCYLDAMKIYAELMN